LLKKPTEVAPSLETDLHIHPDSQQPVIPRHVREQLQTDPELRKEPVLSEVEAPADAKAEQADPVAEPIANESSEQKAEVQTVREVTVSTAVIAEAVKAEEKSPELSLNQIEKAEISEFEDESNILDAHLHEQKLVDEESALATAETYIALNVYPDSRALSGEKTLKVLMKYGLRFGEMACFHRYSEDDSKLLFSVLQIGNDGAAAGFDLETLSTEQVKGLAFFLALPHSDVQNAFDTMDSISRLIAREIAGTVYDQNNQEFTPQLREHWRHQAIDYRIGQAVEA